MCSHESQKPLIRDLWEHFFLSHFTITYRIYFFVYAKDIKSLDLLGFHGYTAAMSDTARDYQTIVPASTDGMDDFFAPEMKEAVPVAVPEGVPVETAATALGLTDRAVLKRLRRGTLKGFKVPSKYGEKWLVSSLELPGGLPSDLVTQGLSVCEGVPVEVEEVPFLGLVPPIPDAGVPAQNDQDIDRFMDLVIDLQAKLDRANEQLQGATYRNGYLESKLEERDKQILMLTDSQHKGGWWAKFSSWFFKAR